MTISLPSPRDFHDVAGPLAKWVAKLLADSEGERLKLEALWVYEALDIPEPKLLAELLQATDPRVRAATVRTAVHWQKKIPVADLLRYASKAANDEHPRVRLEAVRALADIPDAKAAESALVALDRPMDRFLDFALWTTMRDLSDAWLPALKEGKFNVSDVNQLTFALKAVDSPEAVAPLLALIKQDKIPADRVEGVLSIVATLGGPKELGAVFDLVMSTDTTLHEEIRAKCQVPSAKQNSKSKRKKAKRRGRSSPFSFCLLGFCLIEFCLALGTSYLALPTLIRGSSHTKSTSRIKLIVTNIRQMTIAAAWATT